MIDTQTIADGMIVRVKGDIDFSRSPELRQGLLGALRDGLDRIIVDLAGVQYMDSSGVAVLVELLQTQRKRSQKLVLCNMQPKVKGIFEIARLHLVFTIVNTVDAAMEA
ncbi:MAG: STAS domain-containing protein [Phycisphaeraceae bacterium]